MLLHIRYLLKRFIKDEKGQALTEYGLIIAVVAILVIVGLTALKDDLNTLFESIGDNF